MCVFIEILFFSSLVVNAFGVTVAIGGGKFVQVQRYLTRSFSSHGLRICVLFCVIRTELTALGRYIRCLD